MSTPGVRLEPTNRNQQRGGRRIWGRGSSGGRERTTHSSSFWRGAKMVLMTAFSGQRRAWESSVTIGEERPLEGVLPCVNEVKVDGCMDWCSLANR